MYYFRNALLPTLLMKQRTKYLFDNRLSTKFILSGHTKFMSCHLCCMSQWIYKGTTFNDSHVKCVKRLSD